MALHYRKKTGLVEQHYSPKAKAWSKPQVVYRTKMDACQGIELREANGTVGVIADFGLYCYDGEPPRRSLALVGTGSMRDWDVDVTADFDGWRKVVVDGNGKRVTFSRKSWAGRWSVVWKMGDGYSGKKTAP
ncbi:hypothetical protein ACFVY0_47780 [Streptomyces sp. NPDC058286]|uniref:hypothetical protein n=1 Tax=Streptomyces sp. NPDC058286 TaxID=3346422 RepID=UPI0036E64B2C